MKRLSLCLMAVVGLTWHARAADPDVSSALPSAAMPVACDPAGPAVADDCWSGPGSGGRSGMIGGVGVYIIQPFFQNNPAFFSFPEALTRNNGSTVTTTVQTSSQTDFGQHTTAAPEFWLGYIGESGLGFRSRFWYFRQGAQASMTTPAGSSTSGPNGGSSSVPFLESANPASVDALRQAFNSLPLQFVATSKLQLLVIDNEVIQDVRGDSWDFLLSGGVRYAHIAQSYNAYMSQSGIQGQGDTNPGNQGSQSGTLLSGASFNGLGPVGGLEIRRFLGNSGLALYGKGRGAFLFGSANQTAISNNVTLGIGGDNTGSISNTLTSTGSINRSTVLPVLEGEMGLELNRAVGRSVFFGQIGAVAMNWFNGGSASHAFGNDATNNSLGFLGFVVRLGINY